MLHQTIASNEFFTVEYLPEKGTIQFIYHLPGGQETGKSAVVKAAEFMKEHGIEKWLSDMRHSEMISPENVAWVSGEWGTGMIANGWKYWALVVPTDLMEAGSLTPIIEQLYEKGLRMMVFATPEKAQDWLDQF